MDSTKGVAMRTFWARQEVNGNAFMLRVFAGIAVTVVLVLVAGHYA